MQVSEETKAAAAAWVNRWGCGQVGREPHVVNVYSLAGDVPTIDVFFAWGITHEQDHERAHALLQRVINYEPLASGRGVVELIGGELWAVLFYGELRGGIPRYKAQLSKWTPRARTTFERRQQLGDALDPVQSTLAIADRRPATLLGSILGVRDV